MTSGTGRTEEQGVHGVTSRLVGGRYRLEAVLGRGAMGTVWSARDELLARDVAVKEVVPPSGLDDEQRTAVRERTLGEARAAARISSDAAVTVYDVVEEDERPWIVMERLGTRTLDDVVRERGPLPATEVATIGIAVLDALAAAHAAGVMHRDVKPGNVMVGDDGSSPVDGGNRVVLTDFGIAHLDGDPSTTSTGLVMGSPQYVAPERAQGRPATPASDLWSLGATLYAASEGHPPHQRDGALPTMAAIVSEDAPPATQSGALAPVLARLLSRDAADRGDAATTRDALLRVAQGRAPVAPTSHAPAAAPVPPPGVTGLGATDPGATGPGATGPHATGAEADGERPTRRRPSWFVLAVVAAGGVLAALVVALVVLDDSDAGGDPATQTQEQPSEESPPAETDPDEGQPEPGAEDEPSPSASPPAPSPSETEEPPADESGGVPEGFELYEDETGFSVAVPQGWEVSRDGPRVQFSDPQSANFLRVDQTDEPQADPVEDWERQEESVSQDLPNYERISIEPVEYRDYDAADWQFTFGEGERTRVLNRNMITAPDQAYALYWSTPDAAYDESFGTFEVIAETFTPR